MNWRVQWIYKYGVNYPHLMSNLWCVISIGPHGVSWREEDQLVFGLDGHWRNGLPEWNQRIIISNMKNLQLTPTYSRYANKLLTLCMVSRTYTYILSYIVSPKHYLQTIIQCGALCSTLLAVQASPWLEFPGNNNYKTKTFSCNIIRIFTNQQICIKLASLDVSLF